MNVLSKLIDVKQGIPLSIEESLELLLRLQVFESKINQTAQHHNIEKSYQEAKTKQQKNDYHPHVLHSEIGEKTLIEAIRDCELKHFRTDQDTGASEHAQIVLNTFRHNAGLPPISKNDLPVWDGKQYAAPIHSNLIANSNTSPAQMNWTESNTHLRNIN